MGIGLLAPEEEMLVLSQRDRDRLSVLRQVNEELISPAQGARALGLSVRQFRRLRRRFEAEGDAAVVHRGRGRPSNHRLDPRVRQKALERAKEPQFRDFGPTLLAEHLSRDSQIGPLKPDTLRSWLIQTGLWEVRRSRPRHRQARPRRTTLGELIQLDGSDHRWLEDRYPDRITLLQAVDDATNRLQFARFVVRETGAAHRQLLVDYLKTHGRPVAFYTDRAACFGGARRHPSRIPLEEREATETLSVIRSALQALGVQLVLAYSPQAKGRVERDFGTAQDRLVKEMRIAGISSLAAANRFLETHWIPFWNERFAVEAAESGDVHGRLPKRTDLDRLFAETKERVVSNDFTIRYRNQRLQIPKAQAKEIRPKNRITVELRLDGTTRFRFENRYLQLEPVHDYVPSGPNYNQPKRRSPNGLQPRPAPQDARSGPRKPPPKPAPDHPWRRSDRPRPRAQSTPTASRPALSSPENPG